MLMLKKYFDLRKLKDTIFYHFNLWQINLEYRKLKKGNIDLVVFFFVNPNYIQVYESTLLKMFESTRFKLKIIINGKRNSFKKSNTYNRKHALSHKITYLPNEKIFGISCNYLLTNSPQQIVGLRDGQIIHIPYLSSEAMHYFGLLFEDQMYCDGYPLQSKINHVVYTYNNQGSICNLYNTHKNTTNEDYEITHPQRITIFSQLPTLWQSAESVWNAMCADERCEVAVVQLPFYHENYQQLEDPGLFLKKKRVPFRYWYNYDVILESPDVIIFLSPYDSTRPLGFKFEDIYKVITKTVLIPYALGVSGGYIIDYNFKQPIHIFGWKIYARSQRYYELFIKNCPGSCKNVKVVGHPKMDLVFNLDNHKVPSRFVHKIKNRKVILWNSHHTLQKTEWSTFNELYEPLLDMFMNRNDVFLIIRPHPLLFKNIKQQPNGEKILTVFFNKVRSMKNVFIDRSDTYLDAFKVSDGLISDASSLLLEYLPTKKPIYYTCKVGGGGLNDDGNQLIQYLYQGSSKEHITSFIDMVAKGQDPMFQIRNFQITKFIYKVDGKAGIRIKEDIMNSI